MEEKKLWNVFHVEHIPDADWFSYFEEDTYIETVIATDQEIKDFLKKWDKPRKYANVSRGDLMTHRVVAREITPIPISEAQDPYDPNEKAFFELDDEY